MSPLLLCCGGGGGLKRGSSTVQGVEAQNLAVDVVSQAGLAYVRSGEKGGETRLMSSREAYFRRRKEGRNGAISYVHTQGLLCGKEEKKALEGWLVERERGGGAEGKRT